MAFKRDNGFNMEQVAAFLKDAVSRVEASPETYEELKKAFKKNVPLTRRSYVAAYLMKCAGGAIFRFNSHKTREDFRGRERDDSRRSRFEERSRDLVGLFISVAGVERERIGNIRVLANYSFVELFKEDADKAINALNGYDYRGRKLAVSYSAKKDEEGEEESSYETERIPDVENKSAPIVDSFTSTNSDTVAQQAAFAKEMESAPVEMTDEEIMAMRAPRSSSSEDIQ